MVVVGAEEDEAEEERAVTMLEPLWKEEEEEPEADFALLAANQARS